MTPFQLVGIISAKGRNGTAELLEIIADEQDDRIPAGLLPEGQF